MVSTRSSASWSLLAGTCILLLAGCGGPKGFKVGGKVVSGGAPLKISDKGMLQVRFLDASDPNPQPFPTKVNMSDASFQVSGKDGGGLPAGKYKIAVELIDPYPGKDKLKGQFANDKTTQTVDINGNKEDIVIDVGKI